MENNKIEELVKWFIEQISKPGDDDQLKEALERYLCARLEACPILIDDMQKARNSGWHGNFIDKDFVKYERDGLIAIRSMPRDHVDERSVQTVLWLIDNVEVLVKYKDSNQLVLKREFEIMKALLDFKHKIRLDYQKEIRR